MTGMTRDTYSLLAVTVPFHLSTYEQDGGFDVCSAMDNAERHAIITAPSVRVRSVKSWIDGTRSVQVTTLVSWAIQQIHKLFMKLEWCRHPEGHVPALLTYESTAKDCESTFSSHYIVGHGTSGSRDKAVIRLGIEFFTPSWTFQLCKYIYTNYWGWYGSHFHELWWSEGWMRYRQWSAIGSGKVSCCSWPSSWKQLRNHESDGEVLAQRLHILLYPDSCRSSLPYANPACHWYYDLCILLTTSVWRSVIIYRKFGKALCLGIRNGDPFLEYLLQPLGLTFIRVRSR